MNRDTDAILASIDGALADAEIPDGMRWSPDPAQVSDAPEPFDGSLVWQPPQRYEALEYRPIVAVEISARPLPRPPAPARTHPRPFYSPQSHAEGAALLPPGGSMLLDSVRADLAERAQQILDQVRTQTPPISRPVFGPGQLADHTRHVHVRLSDHTPRLALDLNQPPDPEEALDAVGRIWRGLVDAFRPVADELTRIGRALSDLLPETPAPRPLARAMDAEARRMAALDARRRRNTGPPLLGPERSHAPRRIR